MKMGMKLFSFRNSVRRSKIMNDNLYDVFKALLMLD